MAPGRSDEFSDEQLADLARLADGTLPADRRAGVEQEVAASPALTDALRRQGVAMEALRGTAEIGAPARLRADIDRRRPGSGKRRSSRVTSARGALVGAVATALLAAVLILPAALSGGLSVADAAAFAEKPPTNPAPPGVPGTPQLLHADVDGVPFPNYRAKFGWKAAGARHDDRSGHDATTIYYDKGGRKLAYTIVSGDPLGHPSNARVTRRGGVEYRTFSTGGRTVVTWERGGRTCVLSAKTVPAGELVTLADWRGTGAIPF